MNPQMLIAGGGIGGLSTALACDRAGWAVRVIEQAPQLSEVGAGIQLGPNATRILALWGLDAELARVASFPHRLVVRSASSGAGLARLELAAPFRERYGAPYACVHRADLQALLLRAVGQAGVQVKTGARVDVAAASPQRVAARVDEEGEVVCDALVGADGLWSAVRRQVCGESRPVATGHQAYRALAPQADLPQSVRSHDVTAWLGPHMHLVAYPVRGGDAINVVAIVQADARQISQDWDQAGVGAQLHAKLGKMYGPLRDLVHAMPGWRLWSLHDRAPMRGEAEMARGRIALVGDAAHPMRPYLAQGAAMAIEDAAELGRCLSMAETTSMDVPEALRRYAANRWQRAARVQAQSRRNGRVFHATGILKWGRDLSLRLLGERLLDQPWLYR